MPTPDIRTATAIMRSYKAALSASAQNPSALDSWVEREAGEHSRSRDYPKAAAIGLLSFMQHPLFASNTLSTDEAAWSQIMSQAEQILQQEVTWVSGQVQENNNTVFVRIFSSDVQWVQAWTQANGNTLHPDSYLLNNLIDEYINESGSTQTHMRYFT